MKEGSLCCLFFVTPVSLPPFSVTFEHECDNRSSRSGRGAQGMCDGGRVFLHTNLHEISARMKKCRERKIDG